ncbi:MAG: DNA repair protein RecO [Alphaproteobacteria bacterium]|nr:DNA repair protein RecO [Alphaproteobacteria bacterium]
MKLETDGLIVSIRPFNERDAVAHIFTENYGVLSGMLRGAVVAKNKPMVGQMGVVAWNARLDSQLGVFHFEAQKNLSLLAMVDANKLKYLNSMFSLIETLLPEREAYTNLYNATLKTLADINAESYLQWELNLLRDLGYALDLSKCSGCGRADNLIYLSPRTGRAVCGTCGAPYADKMFRLPINLQTTLRFLESVCRGLDVAVPDYRIFLQNK